MKFLGLNKKRQSSQHHVELIADDDEFVPDDDGYYEEGNHHNIHQGSTDALASLDLSNARNITNENKRLRFLLLFVAGTSIFSLLTSLSLFSFMSSMANRAPSPVVQMVDGSVIKTTTLQGDDRPTAVVRDFVVSTLGGLLTWRSTLPPQTAEELKNPQFDPGVQVISNNNSGGRVSTATWKASLGVNPSFRTNLLTMIATMSREAGITESTNNQVVWIPRSVVVKSKNGTCWIVNVVSDMTFIGTVGTSGKSIPFNKEVQVCTSAVLRKTEAEKLYTQPGLADAALEAKASGLEITSISSLFASPAQQSESFIDPQFTNQQPQSSPSVQNSPLPNR
jgi:hypothetical protein